jgi:hypothetical protein
MPTWAKVLLAILVVVIGLFAVASFIAYRWVTKNKDQIVAARNEGIEFGKGKDYVQCTDAALARLGNGVTAQIQTRVFADGCYSSATKSEELCATVPPRTEIMKNAQWNADECRKRGIANQQPCMQVMQALAEGCRR